MDWQTDRSGKIQTRPVLGWNLAVIPLNVLVGLHLLGDDDRLSAVQFHMTGIQCRELAAALLRKADQMDAEAAKLPRQ